MSQSRRMSAVETLASTAIGFAVSIMANVLILPLFGVHLPLSSNFQIGAIFTILSIIRSYVTRRAFERLRRPEP